MENVLSQPLTASTKDGPREARNPQNTRVFEGSSPTAQQHRGLHVSAAPGARADALAQHSPQVHFLQHSLEYLLGFRLALAQRTRVAPQHRDRRPVADRQQLTDGPLPLPLPLPSAGSSAPDDHDATESSPSESCPPQRQQSQLLVAEPDSEDELHRAADPEASLPASAGSSMSSSPP